MNKFPTFYFSIKSKKEQTFIPCVVLNTMKSSILLSVKLREETPFTPDTAYPRHRLPKTPLTQDTAYPRHRLPKTPLTPDPAKCYIFYANSFIYVFQEKSGTKLSMETYAAIFCYTYFSLM